MHETPPTIAETYAAKPAENRKRRPNWKALLFVVIFFLLVFVAVFLQSPLSAVSKITVTGNQLVRYEEILKQAGLEKGISFWKIDAEEAEASIRTAYPLIESADIEVSWTGEVAVAVVEKQLAGTLLTEAGFCTMLHDGTILRCQKELPNDTVPLISMENVPAITEGQPAASPDLVELVKQIPEVERKTLDQISEIRIAAAGPWQVFMRDKYEVRIPPRQFADKMNGYAKFRTALGADKPPGIINLVQSTYEPYQTPTTQPKKEEKKR